MVEKVKTQKVIAENRRARFNYELLDFYQAGLVLTGTEVKSLRLGHGNLNEAYATYSRGEIWMLGSHISQYSHAGYAQHDEKRSRKLLLKANEIDKIQVALQQKGLTLVPVRLYWENGKAKVDVALGKGKNTVDKRESIKKRDMDREIKRVFKGRG